MAIWTNVAHTVKQSANTNAVTSDAIDTSTATLIAVILSDTDGSGGLSDSKGNTWIATAVYESASAGAVQLFYAINPIVGAGHTFTGGTAGKSPTISISAWSSPLTPVFEQVVGATIAEPPAAATVTAGPITPSLNGTLFISGETDMMLLGAGGLAVSTEFSPVLERVNAETYPSLVGVASGHAAYEQATAAPLSVTWSRTTVFVSGMAAVLATFRSGAAGPPPINYEDPCGITEPRIYAKVTTDVETLKFGIQPLRDSAQLGGFKAMSTTLIGRAVPFDDWPFTASLVPNHPPVPAGSVVLPYIHGAFSEAIAARRVKLGLNYQDGLCLASQEAGTLDVREEPEGLMFRAMLDDSPWHQLVADMVNEGAIQHCCVCGNDDPQGPAMLVVVREDTGQRIAIQRSHHDVTINLLIPATRSRPSYVGTWVTAERWVTFRPEAA